MVTHDAEALQRINRLVREDSRYTSLDRMIAGSMVIASLACSPYVGEGKNDVDVKAQDVAGDVHVDLEEDVTNSFDTGGFTFPDITVDTGSDTVVGVDSLVQDSFDTNKDSTDVIFKDATPSDLSYVDTGQDITTIDGIVTPYPIKTQKHVSLNELELDKCTLIYGVNGTPKKPIQVYLSGDFSAIIPLMSFKPSAVKACVTVKNSKYVVLNFSKQPLWVDVDVPNTKPLVYAIAILDSENITVKDVNVTHVQGGKNNTIDGLVTKDTKYALEVGELDASLSGLPNTGKVTLRNASSAYAKSWGVFIHDNSEYVLIENSTIGPEGNGTVHAIVANGKKLEIRNVYLIGGKKGLIFDDQSAVLLAENITMTTQAAKTSGQIGLYLSKSSSYSSSEKFLNNVNACAIPSGVYCSMKGMKLFGEVYAKKVTNCLGLKVLPCK